MDLFNALTDTERQGGERLFRKLMLKTSVLAAAIHATFATLFFYNDIWLLAVVNVFSVLLYIGVFIAILHRRYTLQCWAAVVLEIVGHAVLAVYLLGWDSGFYFYAMVIPPVVMISPLKESLAKLPVVFGMMLFYVIMDFLLRDRSPEYLLEEVVLKSLYYFNLATVLTVMVFLSGLYHRLVTENEIKLKQLATTDSLTGLHNRRSLQQFAERELAIHQRYQRSMALLLCDLDNFKRVNDLFGHQAGDVVIKNFSDVLHQLVRSGDLAARWGGEEFLLVLPSTTADEAEVVAERIRACQEQATVTIGEVAIHTTVTIGIAMLEAGDSFEHLVTKADEAMYRGKACGRNKVVNS